MYKILVVDGGLSYLLHDSNNIFLGCEAVSFGRAGFWTSANLASKHLLCLNFAEFNAHLETQEMFQSFLIHLFCLLLSHLTFNFFDDVF